MRRRGCHFGRGGTPDRSPNCYLPDRTADPLLLVYLTLEANIYYAFGSYSLLLRTMICEN